MPIRGRGLSEPAVHLIALAKSLSVSAIARVSREVTVVAEDCDAALTVARCGNNSGGSVTAGFADDDGESVGTENRKVPSTPGAAIELTPARRASRSSRAAAAIGVMKDQKDTQISSVNHGSIVAAACMRQAEAGMDSADSMIPETVYIIHGKYGVIHGNIAFPELWCLRNPTWRRSGRLGENSPVFAREPPRGSLRPTRRGVATLAIACRIAPPRPCPRRDAQPTCENLGVV